MPVRYQRLSARFVRTPGAARHLEADPYWPAAFLPVAPARWRPAVDACEGPDGLVVTLDVAGLNEDRTEIRLFADALVIDGERDAAVCPADARYHRAEIRQGPFRLELPLPFPVDADRVVATYERGLLRVELPRTAPIRIEPER